MTEELDVELQRDASLRGVTGSVDRPFRVWDGVGEVLGWSSPDAVLGWFLVS